MKTTDKNFTPFPTTKYQGAKYFCDRKEELEKLRSAVDNDRPLALYSKRRMGKTSMVKHLHHHLTKSRRYVCIYVDIYSSKSDKEFVAKLVTASITALDSSKKSFTADILSMFSKYSPKLTIDPVTGAPGVELDIRTKAEISMSLNTLFELLDNQKKRVQIAIDEFQQIANYDQPSNMAATIREYMQSASNVHFLFSGSQRHLLLDLFNNPKLPLFRMVDQLMLNEIDSKLYKKFILLQFSRVGRTIDGEVVDNLLKWTRRHTFYVQVVCNKLFAIRKTDIDQRDYIEVITRIKKELEMNFLGYKNILSRNQYKTLLGIAKEGGVTSVRTKHFTTSYGLAPSTANQALRYLVETELVYEKLTQEGSEYIVYDLFLERWLLEDES